jgi:hypothetical protein
VKSFILLGGALVVGAVACATRAPESPTPESPSNGGVPASASGVAVPAPEPAEPSRGTPDAGTAAPRRDVTAAAGGAPDPGGGHARLEIAVPGDGRASAAMSERDARQSRTDKPSGQSEHDAAMAPLSDSSGAVGGPVPNVKLVNIGLHIGGGPNDAQTKAPFLRALAGAFDDFKRCYGLLGDANAHGTFGIDLLVPAAGEVAATSNPRTAFTSAEFRACMVESFARVRFDPPRRGATKLSYALRFGNP